MSDEGSNEAAAVQALTAEVRTLVVGSRQVTMGIYAQIDRVEPGRLVPFGRVRPRDGYGWVCVVGRHVDTGALVRSRVRSKDPLPNWQDSRDAARRASDDAIAREWSALPLIVLAGLR